MAIALFLFLNPYQLVSQATPDTIEFEECALSADEVENFSEFKTSDAGTAAEQSHHGEVVEASSGFTATINDAVQSLRGKPSFFHKTPRTILFQVFRI